MDTLKLVFSVAQGFSTCVPRSESKYEYVTKL